MCHKDIAKKKYETSCRNAHMVSAGLETSGSIFLDAKVEQSAHYVTNKALLNV